MAKRMLTALIGLIFFFAILFSNYIIFSGAICICVFGMLFELYRSVKLGKTLDTTGYIGAAVMLASIIFGKVSKELAIVAFIGIYLTVMVALHSKVTYKDVCAHGFLTLFISMCFGTMIRLYNDFGNYAALLVFICAWMTDSGAYFVGCGLGKHKLIPHVSPKKTVEGAIGGVITAVVSCLVYMVVLQKLSLFEFDKTFGYGGIAVVALFASVFSQIGDLVASCIKRDCNIKDFGTLLPGHGGILDRFDSVIYITPVIYYLLVIVSK